MFRLLGSAVMGLVVTLGWNGIASAAPEDKEVKEVKENTFADMIGTEAPNLHKPVTLTGKTLGLSKLKGKVVLLDFWAVWCGPCVGTFPHLTGWHDKYQGKGLEIVGLTSYYKKFEFDSKKGKLKKTKRKLTPAQERAMLKKFAAHHHLRYRLAILSPKKSDEVMDDYEVESIPHLVLIDRKGNIRLVKEGADKETTEAVAKKIEELLAE